MKKRFIILAVVSLCAGFLISSSSFVFAQTNIGGVKPQHAGTVSPAALAKITNMLITPHHEYNTTSGTGMWLQYWSVLDSFGINQGATPLHFYDDLFPDSSVQASAGGYVSIHLIGNVLDPNSSIMQQYQGYSWNNSNSYTVDSISLFYNYSRNTVAGIVDTLVLYLWNNAVLADIDTSILAGVALLPYDSVNLNKNKPKLSVGALKTFKIPLTIADTATTGVNVGLKVVNTNMFSVPAGKLVASAWGFIPGYSFNPGENISQTKNDFAFLSSEPSGDPNGDGTGSYTYYEKGDWNNSSIVNNQVRYNSSPGTWDGWFIPSVAFNLGYVLQEHLISYYVTAFTTGLNEYTSAGCLKLFQNQPNPANRTTVLKYETKTAGPVSFEVRDLTGRLVMELNEGTQSAGTHAAVLDVSTISKGMYLYTLKSDKESVTCRMTVE